MAEASSEPGTEMDQSAAEGDIHHTSQGQSQNRTGNNGAEGGIDQNTASNAAQRSRNTENLEKEFKVPTIQLPPRKPPVVSGKLIEDSSNSKPSSDQSKGDNVAPKGDNKQILKEDNLSPAEQLKIKEEQARIPYNEPIWGGIASDKFYFEVLKNGSIIDNIDLTTKSFYVFGRLPSCDVTMEHPSLSRYHSVVQYCSTSCQDRERGWYLYDLDSTHGTWINKHKVPPKKYLRIRVGHVIKFGGSTRLHILQGPDTDAEEESELTVTEMKEQREKQIKEAELLRQAELAEEERKIEIQKKKEEARGCMWGIDDTEDAEEDDEENPFAEVINPNSESLYIEDPKKTLKGFFEREGLELPEYEFVDAGFGKRKCTVELPIDTPTGEPVRAEVTLSGKKKEAVVACALEACRILDRQGLLRASTHESHKKKKRNWEEDDFYDSDEDIYLDRTGTIEKKRQMRMNKSGKDERKAETFDSLMEKHQKVLEEINDIEEKLEKAKAQAAAFENEEVDALDAYMSAIKSGVMDTKTKMKLKRQLLELKQEEQKVRRLINIAQPTALPALKPATQGGQVTSAKGTQPKFLSSVGKMKGFGSNKGMKPVALKPIQSVRQNEGSGEEEDDEEMETSSNDKGRPLLTSVDKGSSLPSSGVEKLPISTVSSMQQKEENKISSSAKKRESGDRSHTEVITNKPEKLAKPENMPEHFTLPKVPLKAPSNPSGTKGDTSKVKEKGPSLPLSAVLERLQEEGDEEQPDPLRASEEQTLNTNKRQNSQSAKNSSKKLKTDKTVKHGKTDYDSSDPDYAVWLPPENQSGDGKTHLNEKYGY